jgi:hypothetical protein
MNVHLSGIDGNIYRIRERSRADSDDYRVAAYIDVMIGGKAMDTIELDGKLYESAGALKTRVGIAEVTLNRYMKKGLPKPIRIAGKRFFDREQVDKWMVSKLN